jgi:uncharacterized protein (DUF1810 family)
MESLDRYKNAQAASYETALKEIRNGKKESHWMWYIFPQIIGLGETSTSIYYSIKSIEEAEEYLNDEVLGTNLREITNALLELESNDPVEVFGPIDALKLKSSMTLFDTVSSNDIFNEVLEKFYNGEKCLTTINMVNTFSNKLKLNKYNG